MELTWLNLSASSSNAVSTHANEAHTHLQCFWCKKKKKIQQVTFFFIFFWRLLGPFTPTLFGGLKCVKSRKRCHQKEENRWGRKRWKHTLTVHFCFAAVRATDLNCVTSLTKLINSLKKKKKPSSPSFNQCQQPITIFHHQKCNNTNVIKEENSWTDKISNSLLPS